MKSGSSTLTRNLNAHPSIFMGIRPKEPHHLLTREELLDVYPLMEELGFYKDEVLYRRLFEGHEDCAIWGDASQSYGRLNRVKGAPERLAAYNPDARILYIMRDPIVRTISHYWYSVNFFGEGRPMLQAMKENDDYRDTSYYAMQLKAYLEHFPREQIMAITLEDLRDEPVAVMQQVYGWLGVDESFVLPKASKINETAESVALPRGLGLLHRLRHSRLWDSVGSLVPGSLRRLARSMAEQPVDRSTVSTSEVEAYLRPTQEAQTRELEELLGREFVKWNTLRPPSS